MQYQVVFEISDNIFNEFSFVLFDIVFVIICALLIRYRKYFYHKMPKLLVDIFSFFFFVFSLFSTIISGYSLAYKHYELLKRYKSKEYKVVEGVVKNFVPMPYLGYKMGCLAVDFHKFRPFDCGCCYYNRDKMERFTVNGISFKYSDFIKTPGFNKTSTYGGPIREGERIRIRYIGNTILKLEIATDNK